METESFLNKAVAYVSAMSERPKTIRSVPARAEKALNGRRFEPSVSFILWSDLDTAGGCT